MSSELFSRRRLASITAACLISVALPAGAMAQKVKTRSEPAAPAISYSVSIPTVDAVDSSLDEAVLAEILSGKLIENAESLATLDAASISVPEITIDLTSEIDGEVNTATLTFTDLVLENVVDGVAASVSLGGSDLTSDEGKGTFGVMSAANFDIGGVLGIYGLVQTSGTELKTIYTDFTVEGGSFEADDMACHIGAASAAEFKGRPLKTNFMEMMAFAQALEDNPDDPDPATVGKIIRMYADIFTAFETSDMVFEGFDCEGTDSDGQAMSFAIAGMTMGGMKPGFYPTISMDGLDVTVEDDGFMRLENFTLKQMDLAATIATLENAPELVDESWLEANARLLIPAFEGFSFSGFTMDIPDPDAEDARIKVDIGAFDLTLANYINGIPGDVDTSASNIRVALPADSDDEQIQQLVALGITEIDAGFRFAAAWDAATDAIVVEEASLTGADLASVFIAGTVANATEALFSLDENEALAAAMDVAVKSLDLTVNDAGLSDIILSVAAAEQGADPATLRPVFAGLAEGTVIGMMAGAADAAKLGSAVNSFVSGAAKSLNIVIEAKDDPGLGMMDFMAAEDDPASLIGKVNISATAK